ncbi:hypothetical protein [Anaerorhabdus furcosa]|uniref:Uncharacterized protein n=1 Tax=Anaerorhabdus furcosa TaxID=118967 RepID=A0A1T4MR39_9FIRM|nr:hypothetical protein [Anaerorhabdus furcosa]SJZ69580.1 hypothetical protein SAMN02745191_1371 [Anaerorhabdus furcosa]
MNFTDAMILLFFGIGILITIVLMRKTKKENCSGTCLGCAQETSCRIKNLKEDYDQDKKKASSAH